MSQVVRLILRALPTWALEAAALYLMLRYLPGVTVVSWQAAAAAILAVAPPSTVDDGSGRGGG